MTSTPAVSIVMPVFNDETTLAASIESALAQTRADIEVICVDDASTDGSAAVVKRLAARDDRVKLIRQSANQSAFQARRAGILAAQAEYVLFLDGDDQFVPDAVEKALAKASEQHADLIGFGVTVVENDGSTGGAYERRLLPPQHTFEGTEQILHGLFPIGKAAQGQLWRYMFRTQVLRDAYALLPEDLVLPRVNDLPLMFLVAALANTYVAFDEKLYRYHFGRGGSGQVVDSVERAEFYASAIRSLDSISDAVETLAQTHASAETLRETYASARLSIVGYVTSQLILMSESNILDAALAHLHTVASSRDIIQAAARFYPRTLKTLKTHTKHESIGDRDVRSVLLVTSTLRTGGVSAVLASQARYLGEAGYSVTIVARNQGSDPAAVPAGATFIELAGKNLSERLTEWGRICREHSVDVVIDHQILYMNDWPEFALMARSEGAATIGWLHNFVGRPIYEKNRRLSLIEQSSATLAHLVVLSPLDVAYFKLRGIEHVSFVPNPPSPMLNDALQHPVAKRAPGRKLNLVWWGRLEQRTKQVSELIEIGVQLRRLDVDFSLKVIGPGWDDLTPKKFNAMAHKRGVGEQVRAIGPLHGADLMRAIDAADAFVSTSIIEGYQLTIAEAQARGLPVFMYELPWLTLVQQNDGLVTAEQGDARGLAIEVIEALRDEARYAELSKASVEAAERARDYDFAALYRGVVTDSLPAEFSPQPTLEDADALLGLLVFFAENSGGRKQSAPANGLKAKIWSVAAPVGKKALKKLPGLRPLAHRVKGALRLR